MRTVFKVLACAAGLYVVEAETSGFKTGDIVSLRSLASHKNPARRFLDGYVMITKVFLSPNNDNHYPGTKWKVKVHPGNTVSLESLAGGGKNVWLDGRPFKGEVGLAPGTDGVYAGTKWSIERVNNGYALKCMSSENSKQPVFLDGNTADGVVKLVPNTGNQFSGSHWEITRMNGPNPPVKPANDAAKKAAEAKKKEEEKHAQEAAKKIKEQAAQLAKKANPQPAKKADPKPVKKADPQPAKKPTPQPAKGNPPGFKNGEHITLKCNGKSQYLDGWLISGSVALAPSTDGEWTGTHWKVMTNSDKTISLMNMSGDGVNILGVLNGKVGLAAQRDGSEAHWSVEKQSNGLFALKGKGNQYLSCGKNVGLSGSASNEAHWEINKI